MRCKVLLSILLGVVGAALMLQFSPSASAIGGPGQDDCIALISCKRQCDLGFDSCLFRAQTRLGQCMEGCPVAGPGVSLCQVKCQNRFDNDLKRCALSNELCKERCDLTVQCEPIDP